MISGKYKTILSDTIISIAIVQLTAACMVSAAMAEVEAGRKDKHVALVSKAYLVLLLHILTLVRDNNDYRLQNYRIILCNRRVLQTF